MLANPGGLIYGTISVAALLAAESARQETYPRTVGAVAVTLLLYWLAYSYSHFAGDRIQNQEPFRYRALLTSAAREIPILFGAVIPLLVLLVCWVLDVTLLAAVAASIWTAAAMVIATEVAIGVRADLDGRELAVQTLIGAVLGLLVIALRVLLH